MNVTLAKADRRAASGALLSALPAAERARQARALCAMILETPAWAVSRRPLLFVPLPDEIDIRPLIVAGLAAGKRVCLPAFDAERGVYLVREICDLSADVSPGRFRIPEPGPHCRVIPTSELDLLLVPGLAFDLAGGRLGRGKGFYDRLLAPVSWAVWGVGFLEQIGPPVPMEPHDRRLAGVITADGWLARPS